MTHEEIELRLKEILSRAAYEHFEDGRTSTFEENFWELLFTQGAMHKQEVLQAFLFHVKDEKENVLAEALGMLARLRDRNISAIYRRFIHDHVYHASAEVRDKAVAAIEDMEHPRSESVLREYISWETVPHLKRYAEAVLAQFTQYYDEEQVRELKKRTETKHDTELARIANALEAHNTKLDILVETFGVIITQLLFKKISFAFAEENEEQESSPPAVP